MFSARGAGILGFSQFGRDTTYLLDEEMELATDALLAFSERHHGEPVFLFGFTFMVWEYLFKRCVDRGVRLDLRGGQHPAARRRVEEARGGARVERGLQARPARPARDSLEIHNYYGMVEQTGAIHMECERGFFHAPWCGDVLVRDSATLDVLPFGSPGLVQVMSDLPRSYPGHVLLTEDIGESLVRTTAGAGGGEGTSPSLAGWPSPSCEVAATRTTVGLPDEHPRPAAASGDRLAGAESGPPPREPRSSRSTICWWTSWMRSQRRSARSRRCAPRRISWHSRTGCAGRTCSR